MFFFKKGTLIKTAGVRIPWTRDVLEWLLTFPFPAIPIYSIAIPNFLTHSHSHGIPECAIPIPSRSHSHEHSGIFRPNYSLLFTTVRVLHYHPYSTEILIIYHCVIKNVFYRVQLPTSNSGLYFSSHKQSCCHYHSAAHTDNTNVERSKISVGINSRGSAGNSHSH